MYLNIVEDLEKIKFKFIGLLVQRWSLFQLDILAPKILNIDSRTYFAASNNIFRAPKHKLGFVPARKMSYFS